MVLSKLPMPGLPTYLAYSRARPTAFVKGAGKGFWTFSLLSPSLWETVRFKLKYCLKGPLSPK